MSDLVYLARILEEYDQLTERIAKLGEFTRGDIFPTLAGEDQNLLVAQGAAMSVYHFILNQRIDRIKQES